MSDPKQSHIVLLVEGSMMTFYTTLTSGSIEATKLEIDDKNIVNTCLTSPRREYNRRRHASTIPGEYFSKFYLT